MKCPAYLFMHLVLLLERLQSLVEFVRGLIKLNLVSMDLLAIVSDVAVGLVSHGIGLLGGILELPDDGVQLVGLILQRLHLLANGVHLDCAGC